MSKKARVWRPFRYFNVEITKVIDGDTVEANVDLGFHVTFNSRFRLLACNTPERRKATMEAFNAAKNFTQEWCDTHAGAIEIETMEKDSFGRWLAMFRCQTTGEYLNKRLIDEGHSGEGYRGQSVTDYMRSPTMLVENLNEPGIKEAARLEEIGFMKNRTKRKS